MSATLELSPLSDEKTALRREMKARRAAMNEAERARASWAIGTRILPFLQKHLAEKPDVTIGLYLARPFEPNLDSTARYLLENGVRVAAPRLDLESQTMRFFRLYDLENVENGPFNVREPISDEEATQISLLLAPGLGFDRAGGRLGTGGGWYDRVLPEMPLALGVCFDCQLMRQIPLEDHDCRVQAIVTENRWLETQG